MFSRYQKPIALACRHFSTTTARNKTVAVMGASGGKYLYFPSTIEQLSRLMCFDFTATYKDSKSTT